MRNGQGFIDTIVKDGVVKDGVSFSGPIADGGLSVTEDQEVRIDGRFFFRGTADDKRFSLAEEPDGQFVFEVED